jgi:hypothetical protein
MLDILEIYNIKNKKIETSIRLDTSSEICNISLKDKLILILTSHELYIINSELFTIIQKIELEYIEIDDDSSEYNNESSFIYGEILSENSIGVIFDGDLRCLEEEDKIKQLIKINECEYLNVINFEQTIFTELKDSNQFIYFLIYNKDNDNQQFERIKIILLLKSNILLNETYIISSRYYEHQDNKIFCKFLFISCNRFSDNEFIISFKSKIVEKREQEEYYINDNRYKNETIYYYLNIENDKIMKYKICSSNEDTILLKDKINNNFYFLFNQSKTCAFELKKRLKNYELIEIETEIYFEDFYYKNKKILGWKNNFIYFGRINSNNKLEIIKKIDIDKNGKDIIKLIIFNPNLIIYYLHSK